MNGKSAKKLRRIMKPEQGPISKTVYRRMKKIYAEKPESEKTEFLKNLSVLMGESSPLD